MTDILHNHIGPFPFLGKSEINIGDKVWKSGRSTGNLSGTVIDIDAAVNINYVNDNPENIAQFFGQILIENSTRMAGEGDSGSVITKIANGSHSIAGLLFAANENGTQVIANHMDDVIAELNIEAWDGKIILAVGAEPILSIYDRCYNITKNYVLVDATHIKDRSFLTCGECLRFQFKNHILGNVI